MVFLINSLRAFLRCPLIPSSKLAPKTLEGSLMTHALDLLSPTCFDQMLAPGPMLSDQIAYVAVGDDHGHGLKDRRIPFSVDNLDCEPMKHPNILAYV